MSTAEAHAVTATVTSLDVTATVAARGGASGPVNAFQPTPEVREFLLRVLAWPVDETVPGLVNMHWMNTAADDRKSWAGLPTRNVDQFMEKVAWATTLTPPVDIYMCMSTQAKTGVTKRGKAKAARHQADALALKAIWLDIDVKDPPKGYANLREALAALNEFIAKTGLPPASALVASGGGLHVYWISPRPFTPREWQPYAHGLKQLAIEHQLRCDAGVTVDSARVLRVPGTRNCKTDPPRPVKLLGMGTDYDFATDLASLAQIAPLAPAAKRHQFFDPAEFPKQVSDTPVESLAEGLEHEPLPPLDWRPLVKQCAFIREALRTGGEKYSNPEWNLTTLAATFLDRGRALAHRMGNKHPGYSKESTDALYDRKTRERKERGLGWPSCAAIQAAGCGACASCPHLAKGKSPLHLASPKTRPEQKQGMGEARPHDNNPIAALMTLYHEGATTTRLLHAINETFAVVRHGGEVLIARISGNEITFMKEVDFHKMLANFILSEDPKPLALSRVWFKWKERRQFLGRGIVFEPGGPLEIHGDMLNLWRGFGVSPKPGDWSLLRAHIRDVVCSGDGAVFEYLIRLMAYRVQHLDRPPGVAVALLGPQGAGKGVVALAFGGLFGKHFAHILHADHLTGRFNAGLASSCVAFLDEAFWAGDKRGEGTLKALITEPKLQLEAKFRDPIMVDNQLFIIVASNNDWAVPAGVGDRRWLVLNVASTYAGTGHPDYWNALHAEIKNGGRAAMLHDLLAMDLSGFNVRAVPHTAAKADQQVQTLSGVDLWLYHVLQEGSIEGSSWDETGLVVSTAQAYGSYQQFSKNRREHHPEIKDRWSMKVRKILGACVTDTRPKGERSFRFAPLAECRQQFQSYCGAPNMDWSPQTGPVDEGLGQSAQEHEFEVAETDIADPAAHDPCQA